MLQPSVDKYFQYKSLILVRLDKIQQNKTVFLVTPLSFLYIH